MRQPCLRIVKTANIRKPARKLTEYKPMTAPASSPPRSGPLAGVRVIDLTINVLGPTATQILGDMGADVIKVEPPEGDYTRSVGPARNPGMAVFFLSLNRNKRSVTLDLKQPAALAAMARLIGGADVFVHSMRAGAMQRLGLDYESLRLSNPRLIYASAGGYRQGSSRAGWPAYDDIIQATSGIAAMNAAADGAPRYLPNVLCDKLTGIVLASSVGMALYHREQSGKGQEVHVAMMETMVGFNLLEHLWGGVLDDPSLGFGYTRLTTPHRKPYAASDGHLAVLAITNDQWRRLFVCLDRPELVNDARFAELTPRTQNIDALYAIVAEAMQGQSVAEWRRRFDAADVPNGEVNGFSDLWNDPYLRETGFFQRVEHPTEGPIVTMQPPARFSGSPAGVDSLPARQGEHTAAVLGEIGLTPDEIAAVSAG